MGRQKKTRLIQMAPHFNGFTPLGSQKKKLPKPATVTFEEYEAINLCDYELLSQAEAASVMNISRPTLTRIYASARQKIARAMVEGCEIFFEEGQTNIANWYQCKSCGITFTVTEKSGAHCPFCRIGLTKLN